MPAPAKIAWPIPIGTAPMEALLVDALPEEPGWQFEPKWDGFRCLAFKAGDEVDLRAKSGKPLSRYFPETVNALRSLKASQFVLDGELVISLDHSLSFDALQMRLHPAESRIRKLSHETPALLVLFDLLADSGGHSFLKRPLTERRDALEEFYGSLKRPGPLRLSPCTRKRAEAQRWLNKAGGALDGVVAKRTDGPYEPGERAMLKIKKLLTADCVVGGFRYASKGKYVGSLLLGLYDDSGKLHHVGFTSSIPRAARKTLTARLEKLIAPPGFTGHTPGGPSRWSSDRSSAWQPLMPLLVVEVRYDHVSGDRFRHGTKLMRWRPDKNPRQCTFEQLQRPKSAASIVRRTLASV
jgi:ATP-dependent DNA ligase